MEHVPLECSVSLSMTIRQYFILPYSESNSSRSSSSVSYDTFLRKTIRSHIVIMLGGEFRSVEVKFVGCEIVNEYGTSL